MKNAYNFLFSCLIFSFFILIAFGSSESNNSSENETNIEIENNENTSNTDENSSNNDGLERCPIHNIDFVSNTYTDYNGETKHSGCPSCLNESVNEDLNKEGGFRDRVSNF